MQLEWTLGSLVAMALCGCAHQPTARDVLTQYLSDLARGEVDKSYALVSAKDQQLKPHEPSAAAPAQSSEAELVRVMREKTTFQVKDCREEGDEATADVVVSMPDITQYMLSLARGVPYMGDAVPKPVAPKDLPLITVPQTMHLVKEAGEWKVFLDLAHPKPPTEVPSPAP